MRRSRTDELQAHGPSSLSPGHETAEKTQVSFSAFFAFSAVNVGLDLAPEGAAQHGRQQGLEFRRGRRLQSLQCLDLRLQRVEFRDDAALLSERGKRESDLLCILFD
jgi:hypothetical protein